MKKRILASITALIVTFTLMFTACGTKNEPASNTTVEQSTTKVEATVPEVKEIVFPDTMPKIPRRVDPGSYAYDDMSKKYEFEIILSGHISQPISDDKIKEYMDNKLNVGVKFTNIPGDQFPNAIATRFAAGDEPELAVIGYGHTEVAKNLFKQGQLADATPILQYMPQAVQYVTKDYKQWATMGDKMMGVPRYNTFMNNWGLFIRTDWLKEFGMSMPANEDELFEYAKAVVTKDPNKNGKADTYFMAGAAGGINLFMLDALRAMFGPVGGSDDSGFNVIDNKINHPMLDGTDKKYIEFLKKLNDNKLLAPDWFTAGWEPVKTLRYNNQLGMVYYPGYNLVKEEYDFAKQDPSVLNKWEAVPPLASKDGKGGKLMAAGSPGGMFVFSKKAAEDEGKLKRIAHFIDSCIYPNENYWATSQGGGVEVFPDVGTVQEFNEADGTNVFIWDAKKHPAYVDSKNAALADWQWIGYTLQWQAQTEENVGPVATKLDSIVNGYPRYKNYEVYLSLDSTIMKKLKEFEVKNKLAFILGKRSMEEWEKYVEEWKAAGGQKLIDAAAEQLKVSK